MAVVYQTHIILFADVGCHPDVVVVTRCDDLKRFKRGRGFASTPVSESSGAAHTRNAETAGAQMTSTQGPCRRCNSIAQAAGSRHRQQHQHQQHQHAHQQRQQRCEAPAWRSAPRKRLGRRREEPAASRPAWSGTCQRRPSACVGPPLARGRSSTPSPARQWSRLRVTSPTRGR